jgi:hypothetical protein
MFSSKICGGQVLFKRSEKSWGLNWWWEEVSTNFSHIFVIRQALHNKLKSLGTPAIDIYGAGSWNWNFIFWGDFSNALRESSCFLSFFTG